MQWGEKEKTKSEDGVGRDQKMLRWSRRWVGGGRLREENKRWVVERRD